MDDDNDNDELTREIKKGREKTRPVELLWEKACLFSFYGYILFLKG